jgi:hypothetical protein
MKKYIYFAIPIILLTTTVIFTIFVFIPTIKPYEVVNIETKQIQNIPTTEEKPQTLDILLGLEKDQTKVLDAKFLNRELPKKWKEKKIFFKYTYIGDYDSNTQKKLDSLLHNEYKWQKQLDSNGNIVMGGIVLAKDGTYQLHTHNSFTKGNRYFLLGDILDRYHTEGNLVGTQIQLGSFTIECIWEKDTKVIQDSTVPYADLVISTCLERYGDRRLVSGWNIVK